MKNKTKHRDFQLDIKSVDAKGVLKGYVAVFNNVDSYNEKILPGAFSDSLAVHKRSGTYPLMLW